MLPFVADIARLGVQNSLVQTVLKFSAPGVPDTYQGCELWDFSLVDPDNRRPVDYAAREGLITEIAPSLEAPERRAELFDSLMRSWRDGRVKLAATALMLQLRRERAELFADGGYRPIEMNGEDADWGCGYIRELGSERLAVIVARYPAKRDVKPDWDARANLPEGRWLDAFRGRPIDPRAPLREWLGPLPVAVLTQA